MKKTGLKTDFLLIISVILIITGGFIHIINTTFSKNKIIKILITKSESIIDSNNLELTTILKQNIRVSLNLSKNPAIIRWLTSENNQTRKKLAFETIKSYKSLFYKSDLFIGVETSKNFYLNTQFKSKLSKNRADDSWYWDAAKSKNYILNIDYNKVLKQTKLWINIPVRKNNKLLGIVGSGIDLSKIVKKTVVGKRKEEEVILFSASGMIKAHKKIHFIDSKTIFDLFKEDKKALTIIKTYIKNKERPKSKNFYFRKRGENFIVALSHIKSSHWFTITKNNVDTIFTSINILSATMIITIITIVFFSLYFLISKKIIAPIVILNNHLNKMLKENFGLKLEVKMKNEFSEVTDTINIMAKKIKDHTENLESKVNKRTKKLEANIKELRKKDAIIHSEIKFAAKVQKLMIPDSEQTWKDIKITSFIKEMLLVGGDIFDIIKDKDRITIYIADVAGHGAPAAMITMLAKVIFTQAIDYFSEPAEILNYVNNKIYLNLNKKGDRDVHYLTAFVISIDKNMNFYYSTAGHHPPLIYKKETNFLDQLELKGGSMLGVFSNNAFQIESGFGHLEKGDKILLYTDGLTEQRNKYNQHFEISNLWEICQNHLREETTKAGLEGILTDLKIFSKGCEQSDDITAILLGRE